MSFSYETGQLSLDPNAALSASFDTLTPSTYKDGSYRLRRYSCLDYDQNKKTATLKQAKAFVQSDNLNEFQGNVAREYDDLTDASLACDDFVAMVDAFAKTADLPDICEIEIHQMRIIAKDGEALATPEGIHQDGFDYVGVFTIARQAMSGGHLMLWQNKNDSTPLATLDPQAGDFCVLNDRTLWHSASSVARQDDRAGYWDLFVLTANKAA